MAFHPRAQLGLSRAELEPFETFLFNRTGFRFDRQRRIALDVAILSRMSALGLDSSREYYDALRFHEKRHEEFQELLSLVTVSETSFFRNRPHFEALRKHILPELVERRGASNRSIKIWSAGCSTGEEPYSIAIVCLEALPALDAWKTEILATDIVKRVITVARQRVYAAHSLRQMDPAVADAYFAKIGPDRYELSQRVRKRVKFLQADLTREPQTGLIGAGWDIIFCRNVLIYFTDEAFHSVVRHFHQILNPGGYLFLGHAEMLSGMVENEFLLRELESTFVYQKPLDEERGKRAGAVVAHHKSRKPTHQPTTPAEPTPLDEYATSPPILSKAEDYYISKRYDRALGEVLQVLQREATNVDALFLTGKIYADTGRSEEAAEKLRQVTELSPLNTQAYYHLGIVYTRQGKLEAAVDTFKRAIYSDSEFGLAHMNLGNVYRQQNRYKEALRSYRNAITALTKASEDSVLRLSDGFAREVLINTCKSYINDCREKLSSMEYLG